MVVAEVEVDAGVLRNRLPKWELKSYTKRDPSVMD
jgi:hypothetical protein